MERPSSNAADALPVLEPYQSCQSCPKGDYDCEGFRSSESNCNAVQAVLSECFGKGLFGG